MIHAVTKARARDRVSRSERLKRYYSYRATSLIRRNQWGLGVAAALAAITPLVENFGAAAFGLRELDVAVMAAVCSALAALIATLLAVTDTSRRAVEAESTATQLGLIHGEFLTLWDRITVGDPALTDASLLREFGKLSRRMTKATANRGPTAKRLWKRTEAKSDEFLKAQYELWG